MLGNSFSIMSKQYFLFRIKRSELSNALQEHSLFEGMKISMSPKYEFWYHFFKISSSFSLIKFIFPLIKKKISWGNWSWWYKNSESSTFRGISKGTMLLTNSGSFPEKKSRRPMAPSWIYIQIWYFKLFGISLKIWNLSIQVKAFR